MASLKTSDKVTEAFSNCRDYTEKIDMVMFAISLLGDDRIGQELLDWHALQTRVETRPADEVNREEIDEQVPETIKTIEKQTKEAEKERETASA